MTKADIVSKNMSLIKSCVSNQIFRHQGFPLVFRSDKRMLEDELTQELVLSLMEMPSPKLYDLHKSGHLNAWLTKVLHVWLSVPNAQFAKQFFNFSDRSVRLDGFTEYSEIEPDKRMTMNSKKSRPSLKELKECLNVEPDMFSESDIDLVIKAVNELEPSDRNLFLCWITAGSSLNFCRGMWKAEDRKEDKVLRKEFMRIDRKTLDSKIESIKSRLKTRINELRRWEH